MAKDKTTEPYIGSYVLETLTTGMYAESRNAIREYVQNSFDGVRAAIRSKIIRHAEGRISVLLQDDALVIKDNGTGISEASAWGTLTAIGLSKKARQNDAGFRGIGRLAGIAFCNTLTFRTKATGENLETIVTFNCRALRTAITSDAEGSQPLAQLLEKQIKSSTAHVEDTKAHYMVVTLKGLAQAPDQFKDLESIKDYLTETAPVGYNPAWTAGKEIIAKATGAGLAIEYVSLYLGQSEEAAEPIFKAYRNALTVKGGSVTIHDFKYYDASESGWWAWVGLPDKPAMISDERINGIRVRVRNIQIGRTAILDELFSEGSQSKERFNKYYVGEVHITGDELVPNARRDNFEDNPGWVVARKELRDLICKPLAKRAYDLSRARQKSLGVLAKQVALLEKKVGAATVVPAEKSLDILHSANVIRKRISIAMIEADPETRIQLKTFVDAVDLVKRRVDVAADPTKVAALRTQILGEVTKSALSAVEPFLEPQIYSRVRRALSALK